MRTLSILTAAAVVGASLSLLPTLTSAKVTDLGLDNLASMLTSQTWTAVLFYDPLDERHSKQWRELMGSLDVQFQDQTRVAFALLDIRRHPYYRSQYTYDNDPYPFVYDFYTQFPDKAEDPLRISHASFMMDLAGDLYWPSRIALFANDLNVYGEVDLDFNSDAHAKLAILTRWIGDTIQKEPDDLEVLIMSQVNTEKQQAEESKEVDNSFRFDTYGAKHGHPEKDTANVNTKGEVSATITASHRLLLESGSVLQTNVTEKGYYKYETMTVDTESQSEDYLDSLATIIGKYLTWVEGYETLWSDERKAKEDKQTNFGVYLQQMNDEVSALINTTFGVGYTPPVQQFDNKHDVLGGTEEEREVVSKRRHQIPHVLKRYLEEMVLGYGRSPASMRRYLKEQVKDKLGATPEERRQASKSLNPRQFSMFERIRDYMRIVEDVTRVDDLYIDLLADLASQWHNILVQFQKNLNQYYTKTYLKKNPLPSHNFTRKTMDVIDMEDPANFELMADYGAFNKKYTRPAIPVILGNVNMTNKVYTLDYLAEQCGSMEVTKHIRISNPVGEKSTAKWGGLDRFELDESLMNKQRRNTNNDDKITLQQFLTLSETLGNLYLHDQGLPDECDRILFEDTLYGEHQKFRIPSAVASYDLFNRVALYNYARSWPSLFIGKKGTNSKVHVDSGGSGFFMYLIAGRKRWMVYHPSERPYLYDRIHESAFVPDVLGMDKSEEANEYLSKRFPLLHVAEDAYEIIQEPGQLIYIPPDSPHAVENLDDIVGVALNLSPQDAFVRHLHDQIHSVRKFGYTELALKYWLFEDNADTPMKSKDPLYMTFAEYKAQY